MSGLGIRYVALIRPSKIWRDPMRALVKENDSWRHMPADVRSIPPL
jgi:hypothetical protein